MGGSKSKNHKRKGLKCFRRIRHLNMLRRAAEVHDHVQVDVAADGGGAAEFGDPLEEFDGDGGGGCCADDKPEAGFADGDEEFGEADTANDSDANGGAVSNVDTRRELVIAVRCLVDIGLDDFLKSAVGGKMKGQNRASALSRTVSLAQYTHEKVTAIFVTTSRSDSRHFLLKLFDTMMPGDEVITTLCELCTLRGLVCIQDYFVYLENVLNKEPATLYSFLMV